MVAVVSEAVCAVVVSFVVATATAASTVSDVVAGKCGFFFQVTRVHPFSWLLGWIPGFSAALMVVLAVVLGVLLLLMEAAF